MRGWVSVIFCEFEGVSIFLTGSILTNAGMLRLLLAILVDSTSRMKSVVTKSGQVFLETSSY